MTEQKEKQEKKAYHSDDEAAALLRKLIRSKTEKCDTSTEAAALLMEDPLRLFQEYDLNKNGKLTLAQFEQMLTKLFPNCCDDDKFLESIKTTFSSIVSDNGSSGFDYRDNVHNLTEKLQQVSQLPDKEKLLRLFISVFGEGDNEEVIKSVYDDLNGQTLNPIEIATKIHDNFTKNVESNTKGQIQIATLTVKDLWRWIEEHGIPSMKKNENLKTKIASINHRARLLEKELVVRERYISKSEEKHKTLQEKQVDPTNDDENNGDNIPRDIRDTRRPSHEFKDDDTDKHEFKFRNVSDSDTLNDGDEPSKTLTSDYESEHYENDQIEQQKDGSLSKLREEINKLTQELKENTLRREHVEEKEELSLKVTMETLLEEQTTAINDKFNQQDKHWNNSMELINQFQNDIETTFENERKLITTNIKNDLKSMLDDQRKCIGLDVSQTMRFLTDRRQKNTKQNQNEQENFNPNRNNNNKLFNEMWNKLQININEQLQTSTNNNFKSLKQLFNDLKLQIINNNKKNKNYDDDDDDKKDEMISLQTQLQSMHEKYNQFHAAHEQLINDINEENIQRDDRWKGVVTKLKKDVSRLQNNDKKWREIVDKLTAKTQEAMRSFEEISQNIKQKEIEHQQSLNQIKTAIHQTLSTMNNEEFNIEQSMSIENTLKKFEASLVEKQNEKNEQIELLKQNLLDKDKELEKYKNDQNILKYIQQNIVHKNDNDAKDEIISLQTQLKEKENNIKILESEQQNQTSFVLSTVELNQILDDKLSNIMTKNDLLQYQEEYEEEYEEDSIQQHQQQEGEEVIKYLKQELPHLIIDTLKASLIQHNLEKEKQEYQQKQQQESIDDDVESIKSESSSSFHQHLIFKREIEDEMKEALQSNILQIVSQSKEEIIQRIDKMQEEEKQSMILSEIVKILSEITEIKTTNEKIENIAGNISNEIINGINKYLQTLQTQIASVNTGIEANKECINNHSKQINENNESRINNLQSVISSEIEKSNKKREKETNLVNEISINVKTTNEKIKNMADNISKKVKNGIERIFDDQFENERKLIITNIKNDMKTMLDIQRKCIGFDVSQCLEQTKKYHSQNTKSNERNIKAVPTTYKCFRCQTIGEHWIMDCPLNVDWHKMTQNI